MPRAQGAAAAGALRRLHAPREAPGSLQTGLGREDLGPSPRKTVETPRFFNDFHAKTYDFHQEIEENRAFPVLGGHRRGHRGGGGRCGDLQPGEAKGGDR